MSARFSAVTLVTLALSGIFSAPASAESPAKAYQFGERQFRGTCPPPLKFAAGACVRRCPAGYRNTGGYCRLTMRR